MSSATNTATTPRRLTRWDRIAATIGVVSVLAGWAAPADAGTYTTWSCRDGANEPTGYVADWSRSAYGRGSSFIGHSTECQTVVPEYGPVPLRTEVVQVADNNPNLVIEDLSITAGRPNLTLDGARLWWRGVIGSNGQVAAIAVDPNGAQRTLLDRRANFPTSGDPDRGAAATDNLNLGGAAGLTLRAACLGGCQTPQPIPTTPFAAYDAYKVAFTVRDPTPPSGSATGDLLGGAVLAGKRSVTVDATDTGGGLYLARIVVDGRVRATTAFGDVRCRDIDTSNSDPLEFSTIRPCPLHEIASVTLDTTKLGEDTYHDIRVQVVDAAGNATNLAQRTVGVENNPPAAGFFDRTARRFENPLFNIGARRQLNGAGAAPGAILRVYLPVTHSARIRHGAHQGQRRRVTRGKTKRTVRFQSRPTVRGVLTDASRQPIAGAQVWTATRIDGSDWRITGRPHITDNDGRLGFRLPAETPSRQVNLVYFPFSDSHEQAVGRPVRLNVRASVSLSVSPDRVRNGQRVQFRGVVEGLRPGRGVTASLQVKRGHRYTTFRQIRLRPASRGHFRSTYRFTATRQSTRYRFRLLVLKQAGLPYERAASDVRTVVVTP
jgi:hypothetical protein